MGLDCQSCRIVSTPGTAWPVGLTGYTCAGCGVWVQYGLAHVCSPNQITWPTTWNWSTMVSITAFKGAVKALKDLPKSGATGDAYYVTSEDALVVRQPGGWFHFDKK